MEELWTICSRGRSDDRTTHTFNRFNIIVGVGEDGGKEVGYVTYVAGIETGQGFEVNLHYLHTLSSYRILF